MLNKEFSLWVLIPSIVGLITLLTLDEVGIDNKLIEVAILIIVYILYNVIARKLSRKK